MDFHQLVVTLVIYFATAVIAVAISKKAGLGAIIGYLLAGILIGPEVIGLIDNPEAVLHFSELGIVLLLFVIGLELSPRRLFKMRKAVFVSGGLQVLLSACLIAAATWYVTSSLAISVVIGGALALSSTAFALQMLDEKKLLGTPVGQSAFGVLLFQDLIVIPYLALMPLLAQSQSGPAEASTPMWMMLGVPIVVVVASRYLLNPIFGFFASLKLQDAFVALVLALAIGYALLFESVGYSMGLGAFAAGILLADSQYRHQVEATVDPFKGLLLGLFFVAVGMGIPLDVLVNRFAEVFAIVFLLLFIKTAVLLLLARLSDIGVPGRLQFALALSQGGEFAFVLFSQALQLDILPQPMVELLTAAVALSMVVSQVLFSLYFARSKRVQVEEDVPFTPVDDIEHSGRVFIAGFGRFGQIVGRILAIQHIHFTAIDKDPAHLKFMRRFGNKVFFGDVRDTELLRKAGLEKAELLVLAIDSIEESIEAVMRIRQLCPDLAIVARAHNRLHAYRLSALGVRAVYRETFESALATSHKVLEKLGFPDSSAGDIIRTFRDYDERSIREHSHIQSEAEMIKLARQSRAELQEIFDEDAQHHN